MSNLPIKTRLGLQNLESKLRLASKWMHKFNSAWSNVGDYSYDGKSKCQRIRVCIDVDVHLFNQNGSFLREKIVTFPVRVKK